MLAFAAFVGIIVALIICFKVIENLFMMFLDLSDVEAKIVRQALEYGVLALFIQHYLG